MIPGKNSHMKPDNGRSIIPIEQDTRFPTNDNQSPFKYVVLKIHLNKMDSNK
jgi:hypothetical protein